MVNVPRHFSFFSATPPTTAVIKPSEAGIPDARAIPIEMGSAIRNTTIDGGMSLTTDRILSFKTRASRDSLLRWNACGRRIVGMTPSGEGEQN